MIRTSRSARILLVHSMNPAFYRAFVHACKSIDTPFTADEVRARMILRSRATAKLVSESSPSDWGSAMRKAAKDGVITKARSMYQPMYAKSTRAEGRAHIMRVWVKA